MSLERIAEAARSYRPILDKACATACADMWREGDYSDFELREGYKELWKLSEGQDLAYDRPSIGLHYALWYHLQRTHLLIRGLLPLLAHSQTPLTIYDVGCGTGATAWAAAVIAQSCRDANVDVPRVRLHGCDTSPFMLEASDRLWLALPDELTSHFTPENQLRSWSEYRPDEDNRSKLVVASYLLNASDQRYLKEIEGSLTRFADGVGAKRLLMLLPSNKAHLAEALRQNRSWQRQTGFRAFPYIWEGRIDNVANLRKSLLQSIRRISSRDPVWANRGSNYRYFARTTGELFKPRVAWLELNDEQDKCANPTETTYTALVGPAGSGKSVVLVERLVRVIESATLEAPRILVTSFNKGMVEQLIKWISERIDGSDSDMKIVVTRRVLGEADCDMAVKNAYQANAKIWFRNRDKLPTQVWKKPTQELELLRGPAAAARISDSKPLKGSKWIGRDFLANELELVLYGMEAMDYDTYVDSSKLARRGRPRLGRGQRALLWPYIIAYSNLRTPHNRYLRRRMRAWRYNEQALNRGERIALQETFRDVTHVFVDEVQDMTRADIRLLAHTLSNRKRLFVTGDSAQALHTHGINPLRGIAHTRWRIHRLYGSYRLPALMSSVLAEPARSILDDQVRRGADGEGGVPDLCRTAVPGPRPVVVSGDHADEIAQAMERMRCFVPEDIVPMDNQLTLTWHIVHEQGSSGKLYDLLDRTDTRVRKCSMLTVKGLELPLVILPTDVRPPSGKSVPEWVYTALTRANGVLMIAVHPEDTLPSVAEVLRLLDTDKLNTDKLMFWDQAAKDAWHEMLRGAGR